MISKTKAPSRPDEWRPAPVPSTRDWEVLREAAAHCTACPLYKDATQTVFGEGAADADAVLVGEQPGDQEDIQGRPFVGPAGQLLERALKEAGLERGKLYITNTVKHFKWEPRGSRRLHKKPVSREIAACRPWLEAELSLIKPNVLICLGATAAQALLGPAIRVLRDRGKVIDTMFSPRTIVTVHPSSLLRAPDEEARRIAFDLFVADLRLAAETIEDAK